MKHKLLTGIIFFLCLTALVACSGADDSADGTPAGSQPVVSGANTLSQGNSVEILNQKVKFISFREDPGQALVKPDSGNIFILFEVEIQNNDTKESMELNLNDYFSCYVDDSLVNISMNALMMAPDSDLLNGTISPGRSLKGVIGYEVPKSYSKVTLYYLADEDTTVALTRTK